MMNDCQNVEIREVLPELAHGTLAEVERVRVQEHLGACDDCAAELAIIRSVLESAPVIPIDVTRIGAAIPPYRRKSSGMKRVYMELAAACLIGAVGISALVIHNSSGAGVGQGSASVGATAVDPGIALVNTNDLSDAGLAQLTKDLDNLQAMPTSDPESVTPVVLEDLAGPLAVGDSA
ncbi:MAG TPA: zf-HC2 domain-containing protein [Gemmatimonadaceae bacterium]|jgi:predicted anti-sigma-YlaC factor YlaD